MKTSHRKHQFKLIQQQKTLTEFLNTNEPRFPKIWNRGGIIHKLPKGKRHKRQYPINGVNYYYDNFPVEMVLNYPVNNFRVYINRNDYFISQLPPLAIKSGYNAKWDLKTHIINLLPAPG